jgi:hypothetical protein
MYNTVDVDYHVCMYNTVDVDYHDQRVKFVDNADVGCAGVERGNVLPACPSTDCHRGNVRRHINTVRDLLTGMCCWIRVLVNQCLRIEICFILLNRHPHL